MTDQITKGLSIASIVFGALLFITSVAGIFFDAATPISDIGMLSTTLILVLFGVFGLLLTKEQPEQS